MIEIEILLTFVYFLECTVVQCKDALSIYWNRNGHECSRIWKLSANFTLIQCIKIVSSFLGRNISGTTLFRAEIYWGPLLTSITGSSSRLLRLRFSADLTMHWFSVCHFRCMKFKPLVIWIWNRNIAISTIVGTSSHITNKNNEWQNDCMQSTSSSSWRIVTVCVFVCHLFSFYPFYFDFHSARIIFYVSFGFYLWNINKTTADICKRC